MSGGARRSWIRLLPPDDAADVIQESPEEERDGLLALLDEPTRKEVAALLAYKEDEAGGAINPRAARAPPQASGCDAVAYPRRPAREGPATNHYRYGLGPEPQAIGASTVRQGL